MNQEEQNQEKRKPIQICAIPETQYTRLTIYALCDDGTMWVNASEDDDLGWQQINPIPQ